MEGKSGYQEEALSLSLISPCLVFHYATEDMESVMIVVLKKYYVYQPHEGRIMPSGFGDTVPYVTITLGKNVFVSGNMTYVLSRLGMSRRRNFARLTPYRIFLRPGILPFDNFQAPRPF